jgi:type IX secretion system PorP/SprF family membrane protein
LNVSKIQLLLLHVKTNKDYYSFTATYIDSLIIKRIYILSIAFSACLLSIGQDYHFSGFMHNLPYVNPAYAALASSGEVGLTYRNQWPGIPATFVTYGAALIVPVQSLNSGIGVTFLNDVQGGGIINRTTAGILYGYRLQLGSNWQVGAGISASFVMKRFNADELVFRSDILYELGYSYGTVVFENYSKNYPDFSVGVMAGNKEQLKFGVSVSHLTRPYDSFSSAESVRLPFKYAAFVSKRFEGVGQNGISVEPSVFYSLQSQNQELIWGTRVNITPVLMIGAWFRQNLKMNMDAFILSAGLSWDKYNIIYSYDVNMKKINFLSTKMAAHEVTFLYRFKYKEEHQTRVNRKNICPAY